MNQTPQTNPAPEHLDPNHLGPDTLNAYVDGELSPTEQPGVEQHLAACHACTLRVLAATKLKAATARAGQRFTPPPEALARLTAKLHSQSQQESQPQPQSQLQPKPTARIYSMRPASMRPAAWAALAAAILLAVSLIGWRQLHQTNTLAAELLDQHLATLSSAATPQVISTDRHTIKPWFQGRLPFSFNLPDSAALPPDTALKGADLTYLNGQPAALLLFTIHKHEVSIFLTQRSTSPTLAALPKARAGFTLDTAATPDLRIIAVSDVNPSDLDKLLTVLVQAQNATH
ncbi:MAG TPA: zf-HC2 domain-containing protein [Edaphobacter sp.]|jgi:anti-sigma factor RsiW|nr:zf-HC2 domain-containing protein [Edaphobacter sp.]